jgi:hypothetical protein
MEANKIQKATDDVVSNLVTAWIYALDIKNEKGERIDLLENHAFLRAIYEDKSQNLVVIKAAQIGLSTLEILKNIHDAKFHKMDIIYTLPTDGDVGVFVGGKVNRIIANTPKLQEYTIDKDTIEQKQIGQSMIYFRGTWTKKAAIMVTADRLVHDEKDSSKQDVVRDYQARLQHSKFKQTHVFSHPSVPNNGVDIEWQLSDQKEWFIKCTHCNYEQYLSWNTEDTRKMSIDIERGIFICKKCKGELSDNDRAVGRWLARKPGAKWSGYHVSLLIAPWVKAKEIVDKFQDPKQTIDYFYNKVLGLTYAGSGNSVTQNMVMGIISKEKNQYKGRLIIGVDTGVKLRYVIGNKEGLVGFGQMDDYMPDEINKLLLSSTLEYFLKKFENSVMVIDQGGDIIGSRKLAKKYPGRVFLCHYARDRKTLQLIRWGDKDESGNVNVDRNRMLQLVIDEMREKRWRLFNGTEADWYDYWLHWSHIYRVKSEDQTGMETYQWLRSDRDDWVHATVYWRVGIDRFGAQGALVESEFVPEKNSYMVNPDQTVNFNPDDMFRWEKFDENRDDGDWRDT